MRFVVNAIADTVITSDDEDGRPRRPEMHIPNQLIMGFLHSQHKHVLMLQPGLKTNVNECRLAIVSSTTNSPDSQCGTDLAARRRRRR